MKKSVLTAVRVIADIDRAIYRVRDMEEYAKRAEGLVIEFNDFVRDHRSMDWVQLEVDREYEDQCEFCNRIWESVPSCCQQAMDEHEATVIECSYLGAINE
jgi:hypothetical protein